MERAQSPRGSQKSLDEKSRLKKISSTDRLHLLRAWNEMDLHFKESSVDYLWLFYTAFYTAKGADRKEQCYVAKLAIWKERTSFSHEYLVATIKSVHDDNREHYLLFERTVGELNRDGAREEKLDGEGTGSSRRKRRRGMNRNLGGVIMPERLWEAHSFGGDAKRPANLSDEEETGNDIWTTTVKSLVSGVSESSSANLILADDRYQLLDRPFRNDNDVHIASLMLKKPYEDEEEEAQKTTDNPDSNSPVAQEAGETVPVIVESPSPPASEQSAQVPLYTEPNAIHPTLSSFQPYIHGYQSSPQIQRHHSAESDSSYLLYQTSSHLDYEPSALERPSMSVPDLTEARLSPHLFASQLSALDDEDWEPRDTAPSEIQSERVSSPGYSTDSGDSTPQNRSPLAIHEELPYADEAENDLDISGDPTPQNQSPLVIHEELPYADEAENDLDISGKHSNLSSDLRQDMSQRGGPQPVHRPRMSLDQLSYEEAKPEEVNSPIANMDKDSKGLLFTDHKDVGPSRRPVLNLKTELDNSQSPDDASIETPATQNSLEEQPPLSPLGSDSSSQQYPPSIDEVPRSSGLDLPLSRIPSHVSNESRRSTSSRVPSVKSFFSIHSENLPPMPSRKYVFLFELVALANRIHKCKSLYRLFTKNCYWFVGIIFHVVRNFCQIDVSIDDKEGKPDIMKPEDEVTIWVNSGRMGKFLHAIKIMKAPRLFTIQALKRKWQAANARFVAQLRVNFAASSPEQLTVIQHAVDREKARRTKRGVPEAEVQKRLEEERRKYAEELEGERKRAEEERMRAEEELKKKYEEEGKKRYEEERKKAEEELRKKYEEEGKKRYEEERKRVEEERKRVEEERMRAEEELKKKYEEEGKKRYEEERKRVEEERKRVEEERTRAEEELKKKYEEEGKKRYEEERKRAEEERRRYEEERQVLLEELMRYRENERKNEQA